MATTRSNQIRDAIIEYANGARGQYKISPLAEQVILKEDGAGDKDCVDFLSNPSEQEYPDNVLDALHSQAAFIKHLATDINKIWSALLNSDNIDKDSIITNERLIKELYKIIGIEYPEGEDVVSPTEIAEDLIENKTLNDLYAAIGDINDLKTEDAQSLVAIITKLKEYIGDSESSDESSISNKVEKLEEKVEDISNTSSSEVIANIKEEIAEIQKFYSFGPTEDIINQNSYYITKDGVETENGKLKIYNNIQIFDNLLFCDKDNNFVGRKKYINNITTDKLIFHMNELSIENCRYEIDYFLTFYDLKGNKIYIGNIGHMASDDSYELSLSLTLSNIIKNSAIIEKARYFSMGFQVTLDNEFKTPVLIDIPTCDLTLIQYQKTSLYNELFYRPADFPLTINNVFGYGMISSSATGVYIHFNLPKKFGYDVDLTRVKVTGYSMGDIRTVSGKYILNTFEASVTNNETTVPLKTSEGLTINTSVINEGTQIRLELKKLSNGTAVAVKGETNNTPIVAQLYNLKVALG